MPRPRTRIDVGTFFSHWETIGEVEADHSPGTVVLCRCLCGRTKKRVKTKYLISGKSTQCRLCYTDARRRAVTNLDTGEFFLSREEAAAKYWVTPSAIRYACSDPTRFTCAGYRWAEEET